MGEGQPQVRRPQQSRADGLNPRPRQSYGLAARQNGRQGYFFNRARQIAQSATAALAVATFRNPYLNCDKGAGRPAGTAP